MKIEDLMRVLLKLKPHSCHNQTADYISSRKPIKTYQFLFLFFNFFLNLCNFVGRSLDDNFVLIVIKFNTNLNITAKNIVKQVNTQKRINTVLKDKIMRYHA